MSTRASTWTLSTMIISARNYAVFYYGLSLYEDAETLISPAYIDGIV